MTFESFLTHLQQMFNIYKEQGEEVPEDQKVRILYKKIQNNDLDRAIQDSSPESPTDGR